MKFNNDNFNGKNIVAKDLNFTILKIVEIEFKMTFQSYFGS